MIAFWCVVLLVGFGCFHANGLVTVLDRSILPSGINEPMIEQFPLVGALRLSTLIAVAVVVAVGVLVHRAMARPKIADALVQTEAEMAKVTWPTWRETWSGTIAVAVTVVVLFIFLTVIDLGLAKVLVTLMGTS
jgi:preprotein translocase subunit SecE